MTETTKCWEPLTKVARELACDCARHFVGKWILGPFDVETIYRYEATVVEAEERVAALEGAKVECGPPAVFALYPESSPDAPFHWGGWA